MVEIQHRRMTCSGCAGTAPDHPPDDVRLRTTEAFAWRSHALRHHRGRRYVEREVGGRWQLVETIDD